MHTTTLRIDVAKNVFQLHGVDARGRAVFSRRVTRQPLLATVVNPAGLCDRDGGVRECALLGSSVRAGRPSRQVDESQICQALRQDQQE